MIIIIANRVIRIPNIKIREILFSPVVKGATRYKLNTTNNPYNNKIAKSHPQRNMNAKKRVRTYNPTARNNKPRM